MIFAVELKSLTNVSFDSLGMTLPHSLLTELITMENW